MHTSITQQLHTNTPTHQHTNTPTHQHTNTPTHQHNNTTTPTHQHPVGMGNTFSLGWVDAPCILASHNNHIPTHQYPVGMGQHFQFGLGEKPRLAGILIHTYLHTQIILQPAMNCGFKSVMIRTVDTDVVVLAVSNCRGLPNIEQLRTPFGTRKDC